MRAVLFASLAVWGAATGVAQAQPDNGAFYNEQVRRNQQMGIGTQPPAVPAPTIRGPGAFYHDEIRQRQEGRIRTAPVVPRVNRGIDVERGIVRPAEPSGRIAPSSGSLRGTATRRTPRRDD